MGFTYYPTYYTLVVDLVEYIVSVTASGQVGGLRSSSKLLSALKLAGFVNGNVVSTHDVEGRTQEVAKGLESNRIPVDQSTISNLQLIEVGIHCCETRSLYIFVLTYAYLVISHLYSMYGTVHGKGNDNNVCWLTVFRELLIELADMS